MVENGKFNKVMNSLDVLVTAFGAMIGWGWVVSTGNWINSAGVLGTIIGFIIGGIMIFFVGLAYSELTTSMPKNGGVLYFATEAFGKKTGFLCNWFMILSYIGVVCFEACSIPTVLQFIIPNFLQGYLYTIAGFDVYASWLIVAILFAVLITIINIYGVKTATFIQTLLTIIIAAVGLLLVFASLFRGDITNVQDQIFVGNGILSFKNILSVAVITPFFLFGFDVIPQVAEEINVPLKKIGKLMLLSIVLAVSFYALIVFAVGLLLNNETITNILNINGMVTAEAMSNAFNSSTMAKVLIIGGICGIITSWNSFLMGGSRAINAMSNEGLLPKIFSKTTNKNKTPYIAVLFIGLISILSVFFGGNMLIWISNAASFACCVAYFIVSLSFYKMRKKYPNYNRPYKVKCFRLVSFISISLSLLLSILYIVPNTGATFNLYEFIIVIIWCVLGLILFLLSLTKRKMVDL